MEKVVDSKQKLLKGPEIVAMVGEQLPSEKYDRGQSMALVAAEMGMKGANIVQIGNTVFLAHRGKKQQKTKVVGRAFNVDTARNYIVNSIKYIGYLQKHGITHYATEFTGDKLLSMFRILERILEQNDTNVHVGKRKDDPNKYGVFVEIGKQPITGRR